MVAPFRALVANTITRRSAAVKGSGCSRTALTTLKIAVLAPMPSASVRTAMALKPGFLDSMRAP